MSPVDTVHMHFQPIFIESLVIWLLTLLVSFRMQLWNTIAVRRTTSSHVWSRTMVTRLVSLLMRGAC